MISCCRTADNFSTSSILGQTDIARGRPGDCAHIPMYWDSISYTKQSPLSSIGFIVSSPCLIGRFGCKRQLADRAVASVLTPRLPNPGMSGDVLLVQAIVAPAMRLVDRPEGSSGGGTRAAAFSYGVLEALRDTEVVVGGQPRRLIDVVDVIAGVSRGRFTPLAYALYLVDGGVADNIGVRGVLEAIEELAMSAEFRGDVGLGVIQRIVVIVVNSNSSPSTDWDREESPPGFTTQLLQSAGVPIERFSFETVETMKDLAEIWSWRRELLVAHAQLAGATRARAEATVPKVSLKVFDVSFDAIRDPKERAYFMNLPTSFVLTPEEVDHLREVAGQVLRQSAEYEAVVRDLGGTPDH